MLLFYFHMVLEFGGGGGGKEIIHLLKSLISRPQIIHFEWI